MKSPTHILIGWGCAAALGWSGALRRACVIGAVVPDVPVIALWSVIAARVTWQNGGYVQSQVQAGMDALYFSHPLIIGLHNLLHSPLSLLGLTILALLVFCRSLACRRLCLAFLGGAMTHALVDIASHVTDGPLPLWPLDASLRLAGPVSHWDPAFGGHWVTAVELSLAAAFGLYAVALRWRRSPAVAG